MQVNLTVDSDIRDEDAFMVIGSRSEWEEIMRNVDGIGHSPAMLDLLSELKGWGVHK